MEMKEGYVLFNPWIWPILNLFTNHKFNATLAWLDTACAGSVVCNVVPEYHRIVVGGRLRRHFGARQVRTDVLHLKLAQF